jgi:hypothetical protein
MNPSLWSGFSDEITKLAEDLPDSATQVKADIEKQLERWGVKDVTVELDPKASVMSSRFDPEKKKVHVGIAAAFDSTPGAHTSPEVARIVGLHEAGHARIHEALPKPIAKAQNYAYGYGRMLAIPAGLLAAALTKTRPNVSRTNIPSTRIAATRAAAATTGALWMPTLIEEAAADVSAVTGAKETGKPVNYGTLAAIQATYPISMIASSVAAAQFAPGMQEIGESGREVLREAQIGTKIKETLKRLIRR